METGTGQFYQSGDRVELKLKSLFTEKLSFRFSFMWHARFGCAWMKFESIFSEWWLPHTNWMMLYVWSVFPSFSFWFSPVTQSSPACLISYVIHLCPVKLLIKLHVLSPCVLQSSSVLINVSVYVYMLSLFHEYLLLKPVFLVVRVYIRYMTNGSFLKILLRNHE